MKFFKHVLVYTDGSPESECALELAASVARRGGGRLTVIHVAEQPLRVPELDSELGEALTIGQLEELDRIRARVQKLGVEASYEARTGRPFVEIIRTVAREGCDLVVKAAKGRGRIGWPLLGSTALHLVRKCPVPVWLVGERSDPSPKRVMALLASDTTSDERQSLDRRVLAVACGIAKATGAELGVGAAWDAPGETLLARRMPEAKLREYLESARRQAEEGLGRALEPYGASINPTRVHLVRGLPYVELVKLASERADLVVIGTTHSKGAGMMLIREEAEEVINRLDCSIVAVKPAEFVSPLATG